MDEPPQGVPYDILSKALLLKRWFLYRQLESLELFIKKKRSMCIIEQYYFIKAPLWESERGKNRDNFTFIENWSVFAVSRYRDNQIISMSSLNIALFLQLFGYHLECVEGLAFIWDIRELSIQ